MLKLQIERFLRKHRMPPTLFGRLAARDPRLVFDFRNGREPGARMRKRVRAFMDSYAPGLAE